MQCMSRVGRAMMEQKGNYYSVKVARLTRELA